ncbi:MAG: DUF1311 domain-containing protein, partial [Gammaproteobacteria bacterium]|nr:DUF1311 domain-containing protein [Gammaproteobacteria bacterium]
MNKRWITVSILVLTANTGLAASFDCAKARTPIETSICSDASLSLMDDQLGALYRNAMAYAADPEGLKRGQRAWLKERNQCTEVDCLARAYENRISELRDFVRIEYAPSIWLEEQEARIKAALAGKALYIHPDTPSNTPFCHQLLKDVKTLEGMEFVAPEVITDNLDAAEVKSHILNYCPDFYRGDALAAPRKI